MSRRSVKFREAVRQAGGSVGALYPRPRYGVRVYKDDEGTPRMVRYLTTEPLGARKQALWDKWLRPKS